MARTVTFNHPLRRVYIADTLESAKNSSYFEEIKKELEEIERNPGCGFPMVHEDIIVIIKDHVFVNPIQFLQGYFEECEGAEDLIKFIEYSLSWI